MNARCHADRAALVAIAALVLVGAPARSVGQQNTDEIEIVVRTQVDRKAKPSQGEATTTLDRAGPHGKNYVLLLVEQPESIYKLVKPVAPEAIADEVSRQLDAHGFHRVVKGEKPEIVITVRYGRGMLPNPYYTEGADIDDVGLDPGYWGDLEPPRIAITSPRLARRLTEPGVRAKVTKAMYERLFITVRAWKYPDGPTEKPKPLWIASMSIDDPDHRDLNAFYKAMLAVGAPYFDRPTTEEEVDVFKPLRNGHVEMGDPVVIEPPAEKK